jgi:hypothetical protein
MPLKNKTDASILIDAFLRDPKSLTRVGRRGVRRGPVETCDFFKPLMLIRDAAPGGTELFNERDRDVTAVTNNFIFELLA